MCTVVDKGGSSQHMMARHLWCDSEVVLVFPWRL